MKKRKKGYLTTRRSKKRAARSMAKTTKGGVGRISKRARFKKLSK